jgi:hypothetical protein
MREPQTEAQRRRAIAWAIALTANTALAPEQYEWELLEDYAQGKLSLDQVLALLDSRVHHVLYCSKAAHPFSRDQLTSLLEQSRTWNDLHAVTGLLCYSQDGRFVQLIEGPTEAVQSLYARIRQDPRHHQVQTLSDQAGPQRWFPDWRMAFAQVEHGEFSWLLSYLEARSLNLVAPEVPIVQPHLVTLLQAFREVQPAVRALPTRPWSFPTV